MPCLAFVNSWFTAPPYIRSRCFARGSEVVFYYIYFFFDFKFNTMSNTMSDKNSVNFTRREFLGTVAAAAAFTIVPRSVLGGPGYTAPSDMVNLAGIGVGSQGGGDIQNIATPDVPIKRRPFGGGGMLMQPYAGIQPPRRERRASDNPVQMGDAEKQSFKHANIYALCDVDHDYSGHILAGYPKAKKYTDFREMIDKEKEIDAVLIGTPDHTHAVIAAYAMKAGKHVFVEKPMAKTIYETRFLRDLAKQTGVVTQMGNQGHNIEGTMQTVEWIQGGVIGDVKEVHLWTNRPMWRQGYFDRPAELEPNRQLREALYIGDKGLIMHGTHGAEPQLIPERPGFVAPEKTLKRPSNIYVDFIEAIKEGRKAANDFEVSAKLTEIMLLTNIAVAAQRLDLTLEYDAENMRITNCPEANDYFHYEYRKGWSL